ncbi:MAG TPA: YfhO family protein, partial [Anaerolineae bacterium]
LSEVYYPGWRAWVDDGEVQVLRADFLFRALPVAAGTHRVRLLYDPLSFKIGEAIFGVTVLAIGGWGAWETRKSRRQRDQNKNRVS